MTAVGGSIEVVNIWGRDFQVASDADSGRNLGGFQSDFQSNGNPTGRKIKTRVPWSLTGLAVEIDDENEDLEFLQTVAASNSIGAITITYASGAVYQGRGSVVGEIAASSMNATCPIELKGPGLLTKQ